MKARIQDNILFIDHEDVPRYKKGGSVVRNTYFWSLRSIADYAGRDREWEYCEEVWLALGRMLMSFTDAGYLEIGETILEFSIEQGEIPQVLRAVSTFRS